MLEIMFEVPRRADVREFHVTKSMVVAQRLELERKAEAAA
jgi:ATP-dependent protease Clp ATPase subunit